MTKFYRAALPLLTMLVAPTAALQAGQAGPDITVTAPAASEISEWSARVGNAIDREMRYPRLLGLSNSHEGTVDVTFVSLAGAAALDLVLPRWAALLIVAGIYLVLAVIAVVIGRNALAAPATPERTKQTVKEDLEWAKHKLQR